MASKGAVGVVLVLEDLLAGNDISTRWSRYKPPGAIVNKGLVLVNHRSTPIWIGEGTAIVGPQRGCMRR